MDHQWLRPNSPPIIDETVDEETILVNLESGSYYDLNSSGSYIWTALGQGVGVDELSRGFAQRFGLDQGAAAEAVAGLVSRLLEEDLVLPADPPVGGGDAAPASAPATGAAYVPPALNKHTDMQELLLLDPVHEVDATGWPTRQ